FERPARRGTRADRARVAPAVRLTVGLWPAMEVVALDHATEALALGRADHVNDFTLREHARIDAGTELEILEGVGGHLAHGFQTLLVGQASLLQMPLMRLGGARFVAETQLHGGVAVVLWRSQLGDK